MEITRDDSSPSPSPGPLHIVIPAQDSSCGSDVDCASEHEGVRRRSESPDLDQEINNPDELPPSVEIDVVGDLPPIATTNESADSGVMSDMSVSVHNSTDKSGNPTVKEESAIYDHPNPVATDRPYPVVTDRPYPVVTDSFYPIVTLPNSMASPSFDLYSAASSSSFSTPNRYFPHNPPILSSTPLWSPWLPTPMMPFPPASIYPLMSSPMTPGAFRILPPPPLMSPSISGFQPMSGYGHNVFDNFDRHRYSRLPEHLGLGILVKPEFSSTNLNSSLPLDLPLNLTNRLPAHIPKTESTSPRGPSFPSIDCSPRTLFAVDTAQSSSAPMYSMLAQSAPLSAYDNLRLPTPNYLLPIPNFMPLPQQESPLNMSLNKKREDTTSRPDVENTEAGPSQCKKKRMSRKQKQPEPAGRELAEIPVTENEVKVEPLLLTGTQSATEQSIKGVILGSTPAGARPISFLMKSKDKMDGAERKMRATKRSKENISDGDNETKQRNKPELFGYKDITELQVEFYECPERERFCDSNFNFQVPKIPDNAESQSELRLALLRLFANSNLPTVPSALKHSVHALSQYPFMQHVFSLYSQGVDLDTLKFGAYGLAFENIHLVELGDQKFNDILDRMSYLGNDGFLHCLVQNEKTGALCGHVAHEIGKIRRHSKNHYPDKKWVCVFCRVQMCDMTDLERHTATHTELKPFECPQCTKKFCQKVTLTQHMNKGHGQKLTKWDAKTSYICRQDGCSFSKGEEAACIKHLKEHHSQSDYIRRKNQNKWPFNCLTDDVISNISDESTQHV